MKLLSFLILFALSMQSNLDENKDFTLKDKKEEEQAPADSERLTPDINCLVNDFP